MQVVEYAEGGDVVSAEELYADGAAVFTLNEDGCLIWEDMKEDAGADMAFDFLTGHGFSEDFAAKVRHCVYTHRFRKSRPPETIEAKILFDADKLDATGAIGLARTLVYNGQVDRPLYASDGHGKPKLDENEESPSFFREYHFKLKHLYDRFYTKTGAALAAGRRKAAEDFIAALEEEIG